MASQDEQIITGQVHSALQAQSSGQQQSIPQLQSTTQTHSAFNAEEAAESETAVKHNRIIKANSFSITRQLYNEIKMLSRVLFNNHYLINRGCFLMFYKLFLIITLHLRSSVTAEP